MRIVHISDCFAPRMGGIETQVENLGLQQAQAGHAVHVLTATAAERGDLPGRSRYRTSATLGDGLRVHRLASAFTAGLPVHPRGHSLLKRALRLLEPDVVHVHAGVISPFAWDGARAARDLGLPLAITWHCVLEGMQTAFRVASKASGWRSAQFAASGVSGLVAGQVAQVLGRDDVLVVPNGLDLGQWRAAAEHREPAQTGTLRVVASQRLAARKRAVALIRIVDQVHERLGRDEHGSPRVHLTVAGDGAASGAVRSEVAAEGLDDVVTLLGRVPRDLLPTLYRSQDVFVSPAHLEAFGLAALEARAAGLAVVGMADSGITEFVTDGEDGHLAVNDQGVAEALVQLADDRAALDRLLRHNAEIAPAFGWDEVLRAVEDLYDRAHAAGAAHR